MGKRYVFWRKPEGKPYKGQDDQFAPSALLEQIGRMATLNDDGSISRPFHVRNHNELVVRSALVIFDPDGNELNESDTSSIASEATWAVIRKQSGEPICASDFIEKANKAAEKFFRRREIDYVLITSLSVEALPCKKISIRGCELSAISDRRKYSHPAALQDRIHDSAWAEYFKSTRYRTIKIRTSGRSFHEATDKALKALNFLRGLWTLFSTFGGFSIQLTSPAKPKPIGVIHTGPVHTLHQLDGSPAVDTFWYEPGYSRENKLFKPKKGWEKLDKYRRLAIRRINRCNFGAEIVGLVIRYAEALDQTNFDVSFVQMWGILEKATDTVGKNYDETIKRVAYVFRDLKIEREKLES